MLSHIARGRALTSRTARCMRILETARRAQFHSSRLLQAETVKVPQMAESITEGTLKSWSKQVGDSVEADEEVATIETDKIDVSVNAPKSGKIIEHLAAEEDTVTVGQDLFRIEPGETDEPPSPPPREEKKIEPKPAVSQAEIQKFKDVGKAAPSPPEKRPEKKESKPSSPPAVAGARTETRVKMSSVRLRIAERMKESQNAAASLTTFQEIDMSSLISMQKKYKDAVLKEHDVKLGFMSAFIKASCLALKEIPVANASIDGDEIVYRDYVDMTVSVATLKGLVTPVIRNCENMNFVQIEKEIAVMGEKARDGQLTLEDMAGGSFTISNGGVFGALYGTSIINLPQSAVLAMHSVKEKPVVVDGRIVIRPVMVVALTYDHRLLDGREGTTFLVKIRDFIEDPRKTLLAL